jgi:hypothetical protein
MKTVVCGMVRGQVQSTHSSSNNFKDVSTIIKWNVEHGPTTNAV